MRRVFRCYKPKLRHIARSEIVEKVGGVEVERAQLVARIVGRFAIPAVALCAAACWIDVVASSRRVCRRLECGRVVAEHLFAVRQTNIRLSKMLCNS